MTSSGEADDAVQQFVEALVAAHTALMHVDAYSEGRRSESLGLRESFRENKRLEDLYRALSGADRFVASHLVHRLLAQIHNLDDRLGGPLARADTVRALRLLVLSALGVETEPVAAQAWLIQTEIAQSFDVIPKWRFLIPFARSHGKAARAADRRYDELNRAYVELWEHWAAGSSSGPRE